MGRIRYLAFCRKPDIGHRGKGEMIDPLMDVIETELAALLG